MRHTLVEVSQLRGCAGTFLGSFTVAPDKTRAQVLGAIRCDSHVINAPSGKFLNDLRCGKCDEWIGDSTNPEIAHVSLPPTDECRPSNRRNSVRGAPCPACEQMLPGKH